MIRTPILIRRRSVHISFRARGFARSTSRGFTYGLLLSHGHYWSWWKTHIPIQCHTLSQKIKKSFMNILWNHVQLQLPKMSKEKKIVWNLYFNGFWNRIFFLKKLKSDHGRFLAVLAMSGIFIFRYVNRTFFLTNHITFLKLNDSFWMVLNSRQVFHTVNKTS